MLSTLEYQQFEFLKAGCIGEFLGEHYRDYIKGDTRVWTIAHMDTC